MDEISTYSIGKLQKAFDLAVKRNDYFFVAAGKQPLFTDEPFRTETYAILLLQEGVINLQADLTAVAITGPAIITVAPNVTRSFSEAATKPQMEVLFFTDKFLLEPRADIFYLNRYRFFEDNDLHALKLEVADLARINPVFDLIRTTYDHAHSHESALMRGYIYLLIHEIDALHKSRSINTTRPDDSNSMFIKFRNLLTKEFWRQRSVSFYADNLNVTPKYLSEVIKRQTGKTAGEWIDKAIVLEAKVLLQNKDLGIAQISDRLHFSDQSVFGKFFKTHEGISPLEYRKGLR